MKSIKRLLVGFLLCWCLASGAQNKAQADVYIFLHTECPISQAAIPSINSLVKKYGDVRFFSVFTHWDTREQVETFAKKYDLLSAIKHDKKNTLVHAWSVTTTPEVVFLGRQKAVLYRGLLDDSFLALGKKRDKVTIFYLDSAIREYRTTGKVAIPSTTPVGCRIENISQ